VARLVEQASSYDRSELSQIVERLDGMEGSIKRSSQPSLTLEMGLLTICHRHDIASIKALTARIDELSRDLDAEIHPTRQEAKPAPQPSRPEPTPEPTPEHPPVQEQAAPEEEREVAPVAREAFENEDESEEETPASRSAAATEIEELWSDLLDCLHKTSIPAYSLVSMHAFPVSLENDQLTLGVNKEFFQKSIEGKSQHLISAYRSLTGKEIAIKVKVTTEAAPSKKKPDLRDDERPARAPAPVGGVSTTESVTAERATERATATVERATVERASAVREEEPVQPREPVRHIPEPETGSSIIKEAYRIFEGPGSRLIG